MKRTIIAAIATLAATILTAGTATAYTANTGHHIRYVMCATGTIDFDLTNAYGNPEGMDNRVFLKRAANNSTFKCGGYQFTARQTYGQYASVSLTADNGGSVYCAIYDNGTKVSESRDDDRYIAYASCD